MSAIYEKLKLFYLGKDTDENAAPLLYKNKQLTTHALIIGMTGSGKTGLGVSLIEEAAIDNIPSIVIDPKGDMGNLLLTFPNLSPEEFEPWIDPSEAASKNLSVQEYAKQTAFMWQEGLKAWEQDKERVLRLKNSAKFTIYTPGSSAGVSVSVLDSFKAPPQEIMEEADLLHPIISSTVTGLLALVGINADPLSSKEHILLSSIFMQQYRAQNDMSLEELIGFIVTPTFKKVGVFPLETFFPQNERLKLAMQLNAIIASPSFSSWCEGIPLNIDTLLFTPEGKAKVSIFSIAHLNDKERMFFVTLLLNAFIGWMRRQEGTSSLKALLYMDEIFGFFPPSSNPPSKLPMLTLLKQARAFGVGVVLSTQNPVDLDYKGLSNIGTWFIGRLQTAQDKERVLSGLSGIQGSALDKSELMTLLSNLRKRTFLMKNIHEEGLRIFQTRWVLSYLKGPLSREQIQRLSSENSIPHIVSEKTVHVNAFASTAPLLSKIWKQHYRYTSESQEYALVPYLIAKTSLRFVSTSMGIDKSMEKTLKIPLDESIAALDFDAAHICDESNMETRAREASTYAPLPAFIGQQKTLSSIEKEVKDYFYYNEKLPLYKVASLKLISKAEESLEDFRMRVQDRLAEEQEREVEKLERSFEKKGKVLQRRLQRAHDKLEKEKSDVSAKTVDTMISIGSSIIGALFGRSVMSRTNVRGAASGMRSAGQVVKEKRDVARAEDAIGDVQEEMDHLVMELEDALQALGEKYSLANVTVEETFIKPRRSDVYETEIYLLWEEA